MNPFRILAFSVAIGAALPLVADESSALATLATGSTTEQKARACQELAVVGGPKSVPALAKLLDDPALSAYARSALETMDHGSAGKALRDALPRLDGELQAGVATSLGVRRDRAAVSALRGIAADPASPAAEAALTALGRIGTRAAIAPILSVLRDGPQSLQPAAAHAALIAAESLSQAGNGAKARPLAEAIRGSSAPESIRKAAEAFQ